MNKTQTAHYAVVCPTAQTENKHSFFASYNTQAPADLWLSIYFPALSAFALKLSTQQSSAFVIYENNAGKQVICFTNPFANEAGIEVGMTLNTAYALKGTIAAYPREQQEEYKILKNLAQWAMQISPQVSLHYSSAICIEVRSSLRLFGGLYRLLQSTKEQLLQNGHQCTLAITPTPLASYLLSAHGQEQIILKKENLSSHLGTLSLDALGIDTKSTKKLHRLGVHTGQAIFRLPRSGLARRYGLALLTHIDHMLGVRKQILPLISPKSLFYKEHELPIEVSDITILSKYFEKLLDSFIQHLVQQDTWSKEIELQIYHAKIPTTRIKILSSSATRRKTLWFNLINEYLQHTPLPSSSEKVALCCNTFITAIAENRSLLLHAKQHKEDWDSALDQIYARLGEQACYRVRLIEDHRPECAQQPHDLHVSNNPHTEITKIIFCKNPRPIWLSNELKRISTAFKKRITLLSGAERIESGWWDNSPVRRDYFIAVDQNHTQLWIYKELSHKPQWYLHGYFS